jgi:hypothetical protein
MSEFFQTQRQQPFWFLFLFGDLFCVPTDGIKIIGRKILANQLPGTGLRFLVKHAPRSAILQFFAVCLTFRR